MLKDSHVVLGLLQTDVLEIYRAIRRPSPPIWRPNLSESYLRRIPTLHLDAQRFARGARPSANRRARDISRNSKAFSAHLAPEPVRILSSTYSNASSRCSKIRTWCSAFCKPTCSRYIAQFEGLLRPSGARTCQNLIFDVFQRFI